MAKTEEQGATTQRAAGAAAASELASWHSDYPEAYRLSQLTVDLAQRSGNDDALSRGRMNLGWSTITTDPARSREYFRTAIDEANHPSEDVIVGGLQGASMASLALGDLEAAERDAAEAVERARRAGNDYINVFNQTTLGWIRIQHGDTAGGVALYRDALLTARDAGAPIGLSIALDAFSLVAIRNGDLERAARLAGAADRLRTDIGGGPQVQMVGMTGPVATLEQLMERPAFEAAFAAGRALTVDAAVALALEVAVASGVSPAAVS
jgi:hypothetical protein